MRETGQELQCNSPVTRNGINWALYDVGNSAYALNVITLFYPLYFATYISSDPKKWSYLVASSIFVAAVLGPILGWVADKYSIRRLMLLMSASIAFVGTLLLGLFGGSANVSVALFLISNISFYVSTAFYDSLLVTMDRSQRTGVSGLGWALGYLGGVACLGLGYLFLGGNLPVEPAEYMRMFLFTGIFYMSASLFFFTKVSPDADREAPSLAVSRETLEKRLSRRLVLWLIGSFLVMEGVTTVVYFTAIYAQTVLKFSLGEIATLLVITQLVAVPATFLICKWAGRTSSELRSLIVANALWVTIAVMMYYGRSYMFYYFIAGLTGVVIGVTPALLRGCLSKITIPEHRGSIFGFSLLASRAASIVGPLAFAAVASSKGMAMGILTVIPFFLLGSIVLFFASRSPLKEAAIQTHA